jgi:hypothetical protein
LGKLDASHGTILLYDKRERFEHTNQNFNILDLVRTIEKIDINAIFVISFLLDICYIVSINGIAPIFFKEN